MIESISWFILNGRGTMCLLGCAGIDHNKKATNLYHSRINLIIAMGHLTRSTLIKHPFSQ
jgi:hypothetical protein